MARTLALLVAAVGVLAGCASAPPEPTEPAPRVRRDQPVEPAFNQLASPLYEPIVSGRVSGLEVHWWMGDDTDGAVGKALARYARDEPAEQPTLRRWRAEGLRFVRVPEEELRSLQEDAPPITQWRRTWFGVAPRWTEVFRGRRAGGDVPLIIDGRQRELERGVLRFLARCWPAPAPGGGVHLRLELALQLHRVGPATPDQVFSGPRRTSPEEEGRIFHELTLETTLREGEMLAITAEHPGVEWGEPREQARDEGPLDERLAPEPTPVARPDQAPGPAGRRAMTLGEAMLSATREQTKIAPGRVVILLVPRTEEEYNLLPDRRSGLR